MSFLSNQQLVIVWRVYEPCNLGCHFCEYRRDIVRSRIITPVEDIIRFGGILSDYKKKTNNQVLVNWLGGEPLLWKDFMPVSKALNMNMGISLSVTTNGTRLDSQEIRNVLLENYEMITVSVDGFGDFHDYHRGQQGLFEKVKESIKSLQQKKKNSSSKLGIRINTVLMRDNVGNFETFCREIASWGVAELTINQLGGNECDDFFENNRLLPEQAEWIDKELPRIKENAIQNGLKVLGGKKYTERMIATSRNVSIPVDDCVAGRYFLFIDENKKISPCSFTSKEYGIPMDKVSSVDDLLKLPLLFKKLKGEQYAQSCMDCHSTQVFDKFER